jgi:hypothetical protein
LYKFGEGAAFTGSNIDTNFEQYQTAVEEVQNAADQTYVEDALDAEIAERQSADASLQSQITSATPILANEMSVVTWHGQRINNSVTIPDNVNAFSVGPQITIAPGQAVTLGDDAYWTIIGGNLFERDELYNVTADTLKTSDGTFSIDVDNIAKLDTQEQHTSQIDTLDDKYTALAARMTAEEGKTQPLSLGGTGANSADGALTNLGFSTITKAFVASTTAAAARSSINAAVSGANADITSLTGLTGVSPLPGVVNASDAAAGKVGEFLSASSSSAVSLVNSTITSLVSLTLTPGDWDVSGSLALNTTDAAFTSVTVSLNTVTTAIQAFPNRFQLCVALTAVAQHFPVPVQRISVSANTTVYVVASIGFTSGSVTAQGYIRARRVR